MDAARRAYLATGRDWEGFFKLTPFATAQMVRASVESDVRQAWWIAGLSRANPLKTLTEYIPDDFARPPPKDMARMVFALGVTPEDLAQLDQG